MPRLVNKNEWGTQGSNLDQQRGDLFKVTLDLPDALGGANNWTTNVEFAIEKWPFPNRRRETIPTKYLNQTNYQLGADSPVDPIEVPVRYAFAQPTAQLLEQWYQLTSNARTGGVALTTAIKTNGFFRWQVPNMSVQSDLANTNTANDVLTDGLVYVLEGCLITNLKPTDADMTQGNVLVTLTFTLQIDRYYPENLDDMTIVPS